MKQITADVLVIGGGAAGLSAALALSGKGKKVIVAEREPYTGGILNQCIHNGFGLHYFREELTGPEFAGRLAERLKQQQIQLYKALTIMELDRRGDELRACGYGGNHGVLEFRIRAVVLAMGSRERNRGNIPIPGTRPSGIFTAGLAQRLINIDGRLPGKRVVIAGSGDIGLIMARRLSWSGVKVLGVVEIQPYPAGLTRNIVQCLHDFDIPLHLSHSISNIYGRDRVSGVEISKVDDHRSFFLSCDTVLLSVGLIPENEIAKKAGIELDPVTGGAEVGPGFMTSMPGVFACGNVLHIHDLVDYCAMEAEECAAGVVQFLESGLSTDCIAVKSGRNVRYVVPQHVSPDSVTTIGLRSLIVQNSVRLQVHAGRKLILEKRLAHVQPSEMIRFKLDFRQLALAEAAEHLEVSLE